MAMSSLVLRPVQHADQAWDLASVRNTGREFMTQDQHEITPERQAHWFIHTYMPERAAGRMFAFVGYEGAAAVACGLVKVKDGGRFWLTGIIAPAAQGKGYGRELFEFLIEFALYRAPEVWLDVLETNEKAQKLYEKLGFELVEADSGKFTMVKRRGAR